MHNSCHSRIRIFNPQTENINFARYPTPGGAPVPVAGTAPLAAPMVQDRNKVRRVRASEVTTTN